MERGIMVLYCCGVCLSKHMVNILKRTSSNELHPPAPCACVATVTMLLIPRALCVVVSELKAL